MSGIRKALLVSLLAGVAVCAFPGVFRDMSAIPQGQGGPGGRQQATKGDGAIRDLLAKQVAAWNAGDIDGFMEGYWHSEQTTFSGSSGVARGWQALLERYHRNYPNRAAMGHLDFTGLEITALGDDAALILGNWHLDRESGPVGGVFTLVARRLPDGWRIVHDHTSAVAADNAGAH